MITSRNNCNAVAISNPWVCGPLKAQSFLGLSTPQASSDRIEASRPSYVFEGLRHLPLQMWTGSHQSCWSPFPSAEFSGRPRFVTGDIPGDYRICPSIERG